MNERWKYYNEYECNIRCRLDEYVEKKDNPYNLKEKPKKIADDIIKKLDKYVLPVFDILSSREIIIKELKNYSDFNLFRNHLVDKDINTIIEHINNCI